MSVEEIYDRIAVVRDTPGDRAESLTEQARLWRELHDSLAGAPLWQLAAVDAAVADCEERAARAAV